MYQSYTSMMQANEKRYLPTRIRNIPRNLHLFGGALIQVLQSTRQCPLYRRSFPGHICRGLSCASELREYVIPKHAPLERRPTRPGPAGPAHVGHALSETRKPEKLGEYIVRVSGIEPEHGRTAVLPARMKAGIRRRYSTLQTLLAVLIVHRSLLGITQNLINPIETIERLKIDDKSQSGNFGKNK